MKKPMMSMVAVIAAAALACVAPMAAHAEEVPVPEETVMSQPATPDETSADETAEGEVVPSQELAPAPESAPDEVVPDQEAPSEPPVEQPIPDEIPVPENSESDSEDGSDAESNPSLGPPTAESPQPLAEEETPWVPKSTLEFSAECVPEGQDRVQLIFHYPVTDPNEGIYPIVLDGVQLPGDAGLFMIGVGNHTYSYTIQNFATGEIAVKGPFTFTVEACESGLVTVTPEPPTQDGNVITIPDIEGVQYQDEDGNTLNPGDIEIDEDTTVIAVPEDGYEFPDGSEDEWTFVYTPDSETPETKVIDAKALLDHACDASEWHFVITQTSASQAPATIMVTFANGEEVSVPLDRVTGKTAHYATTEHLDSTVVSATAEIAEDWSGQFNLLHGPCEDDGSGGNTDPIVVTPVNPLAGVPACSDYSIPQVEGVVYSEPVSVQDGDILTITIVATPAEGYAFEGEQRVVFTASFDTSVCGGGSDDDGDDDGSDGGSDGNGNNGGSNGGGNTPDGNGGQNTPADNGSDDATADHLAVTGASDVTPIGAIAGGLLLAGLALVWASRRRQSA